ncbi:MAG: flagellin [Planctomycetota bacterium]
MPSLISQRVLGQNNIALNTSLERLSTGLRINRGKDDPAGLIASENLRSEKVAISAAIKNAERADQVVNIAEGGLNEISALLTEVQSLLTQTANDAGLSDEEREANQLQIDSILQTIDRVAGATSFQGSKLLNGNLDYNISNVDGVISKNNVNGAKLNFNGTRDVDVLVTASAQLAGYFVSLGGALDLASNNDQFVLEIAGALGARELSFASGAEIADIVSAINTFTDVTGVNATASGTGFRLDSSEFGNDQFVSIKVVDDAGLNTAVASAGIYSLSAGDTDVLASTTPAAIFDSVDATNGLTDFGQDVEATINGIVATTRGRTVRINTDFLDVELELAFDRNNSSAAVLGLVNAFTITGGGADFQLASRVDIAGKVPIGIGNVAVRELGITDARVFNESGNPVTERYSLADFAAGKDLNLIDGNLSAGQQVIDEAIREVSSLRGRLGAFQSNTVGATIRSLGISLENTAAAESLIRDTDFASETAGLTRAQILSQSAQTSLQLANTQPQNVLQLLG